MIPLDFDVREDDQRAIEHAGQRHVLLPLPDSPAADIRDVVRACLPTMPREAIADMSLVQCHAVCQLAALVAADSSLES